MAKNKPTKPNDETIAKAVAKRKTRTITVYGNLKSGDLSSMNKQVIDFAAENGIAANTIKFNFSPYYARAGMLCRRTETDKEKWDRTKYDLNQRYQRAYYAWKSDSYVLGS